MVVDLGQPGDPRLGPLAQGILGDVLPQLGEDFRIMLKTIPTILFRRGGW